MTPQIDPQKLFVGGLPWALTEQELKDAFAVFGDVEHANIVTDKETNRSRGFGFVKFKDESSAATAKDEMDGASLLGRDIRVDYANRKTPGDRKSDDSSDGNGRAKRRRTRGRR